METGCIILLIGLIYAFGCLVTMVMNLELYEYDQNFPIIAILWFFWPFTFAAYLFFYFLIPLEIRIKSDVPILRWLNKNKK